MRNFRLSIEYRIKVTRLTPNIKKHKTPFTQTPHTFTHERKSINRGYKDMKTPQVLPHQSVQDIEHTHDICVSLKELKKKLSWWGSVFWNAPRLHPVCNKPWDQTKQNATEPRTKNVSRSTHRPGTNSWCTSCLLEYRLRYDQLETLIEMWRWAFENRELCLYHPGKMKIISIQSDTELLSLSRPYSSVYVERKTFMWVTIQGVKIERERKKIHTFFCVLNTLSNPTRHVHTHVRDWENLRKSPSRLERPLPTHTTYLRTPNSTNLFHICICKKCEELRGTSYVWGGFPYPGSKWSLCVKMFFFSCGFVCRKPIRFDLKNLKLGNFKFSAQNFQSYSFFWWSRKVYSAFPLTLFQKKKSNSGEREKIRFKSYMVRK